MQYPGEIQAAILFDRRVDCLETVVRTFMAVEQGRSGAMFNVPEAKPGLFYRLYGGSDLMITVEYVDRPADMDVFRASLTSVATGILCPDIRQRLTRNRSYILVNVSHGVMGHSPEIVRLLTQLGGRIEGQSLPQFIQRMEVCALLARIAGDQVPAQAVHWTQSDQLIPGEKFDAYAAAGDAPSPLHIHPFLFGPPAVAGEAQKAGIRTFGARHFIGGEIVVEPSVLPWSANYQTILAFLRVATTTRGYVIPDGDTFGPEDRSLSYRVTHRAAEGDDVPVYSLEPLMHREYGFVTDDYVPEDRVIDDRAPPAWLMPDEQEAKMDLANEWREKRALAEGIGGRLEVRARGDEPLPPPVRPGGLRLAARAVFGRKRG